MTHQCQFMAKANSFTRLLLGGSWHAVTEGESNSFRLGRAYPPPSKMEATIKAFLWEEGVIAWQ